MLTKIDAGIKNPWRWLEKTIDNTSLSAVIDKISKAGFAF